MVNLDVAGLRPHLDLEGKYVDFNVLRNALTVVRIVEDLDISLSEANKEGERRGKCPKCQKEKSFSLNVNTNRFNCFAKGCNLKGGGVIDFFAKLYAISAKETSHLLACAYSIEPYTQEVAVTAVAIEKQPEANTIAEPVPINREVTKSLPDASHRLQHLPALLLLLSITSPN